MQTVFKTSLKMATAFAVITSTWNAFGAANLTPYQPAGWSDKIVVARNTGTTTDSTSLTTADALYVNWAVINNGNTAAVGTFYTYLYVDGVFTTYWTTAGLNAGFYTYANDYSIGSLSAGSHTITISTDATGIIAESNENDNSYTKTITVSNPSLPNLTPYQPPGWSDKIVVARTTGTTTDSTSLTTADTLYVSWAVINNGNATATSFYNSLYVDGVFKNSWFDSSLSENFYTYANDYSIGTLSAGTHTITMTADSGFSVTESNENDNSYTKNITISVANLPAPILNSPANGGTGQPTIPTFNWSAITGATSYRIMVATNAADLPSDPTASTGGPSVVLNATPATTTYMPSTQLNSNATYYWEVHARNSTQFGTWSSVGNFTTGSSTSNGLTIIPIFDSSITSDPQAATIEATINAAIAVYKSDFSDPVTVSIKFQEVNTGLGLSTKYYNTYLYSDYVAALAAHSTTADDATAIAHLPNGADNPVNGSPDINLNLPLARALGFSANPPIGQPDGTISLYTGIMNLSADQTDPTRYSLFAVVSHEIDEVLGFGSALNGLNNGDASPTGAVFPEDLFRFDQFGARSFTTAVNATSYFSIDGTADLAQFNQHQGGDFADWYSYPSGALTPQVQDAFSTPGATPVLGVELRGLDVIGFNRVSVQTGSLQVNLAPQGAVNAGAQWQVDGGSWQNSAVIVSGLSMGSHTVTFRTVSGWTTPAGQMPTISANQTTTMTGTYIAIANYPPQLSGMNVSNGAFHFVLNGPAGSNCVILVSSNLASWSPISTNNIPAGGSVPITDPSTTNYNHRFFRAMLQ